MSKNNLTPEQQEKLKQIGSKLQRIRLGKGISLDSVAANTRIPPSLLQAIEAGDWKELPQPFYIQALITKFAASIGAKKIDLELISTQDRLANLTPNNSRIPRKYWFNFQLRSLHLYLLYIFLVLVSVRTITLLVERPVIINQVPQKESVAKSSIETEDGQSSSEVNLSPSPSQFVSQSSNSESVTVGIDLQERCWLKVMVDGKLAFEGILPKGTQRQWSGKEQVTIRAGNAGGVVISFNNEQQKVLGAPGEVEEITYTVN